MTQAEYLAAKKQKYQEYKSGAITNYAYIQWKKKNDPTLNPGGGSSPSDPGQTATNAAEEKVQKRLEKVYTEARRDLKKQLKEFENAFKAKDAEMQAKLAAGEITKAQYDSWKKGQVFQSDIWKKKIDQVTGVLADANGQALQIINKEKMGVFAENANFQAYQLTQDTGLNLSFAVYDNDAVGRLIKDRPELLPRKQLNGKKDKAWNQTKIANAVTQSIIQGESIPDLANRIARDTASENGNAMMRYARTAMTSAQNAGRMETLDRAKTMGIKCKKRWLATLDNRTRDTHQALDGQTVDVDQPFVVDGMEIMFPGDPSADPSLVYNCRCTLVYEYEEYPSDPEYDQRRDNETGEIIQNMSYGEWKAAKEGSALNDLNTAKTELAQAQKAFISGKVDESHVYHNIWKDDVTLADYGAKKGSIQAKRDYYKTEIDKIKAGQAAGQSWATDAKLKEKKKQLSELNKFEKQGKLMEARDAALKKVQDIFDKVGYNQTAQAPGVAQAVKASKKAKTAASAAGGASGQASGQSAQSAATAAPKGQFSPQDYTQARKDAALWAKRPEEADKALRAKSGEVWRAATAKEKDASYEYTQSYHKFNEPLRGIEYGTSRYLGVGNTDLNAGSAKNGARLNALTDLLNKSSYTEDVWLQRGCRYSGMDKFFQCDMSLLQSGSQKELEQALLGKTVTEYAFMSCGSNKGAGLNTTGGVLLNVYCPAGTKMMYVEPFSAFGRGSGKNWDGKATQSSFGHEVETLLQQGTQFRVTKVTRQGRAGQIFVDIEVTNQDHQQRWKK